MEIDLAITSLLLALLAFIATVDMAFGQLSDVGLRLLIAGAEDHPTIAISFLKEILDDRPRFRFTVSVAMQMLLVAVIVLVTSISYSLFQAGNFILISFVAGIALAAIFRQFIPRLVSTTDPQRVLLLSLPVFLPLYRLLSVVSLPWNRSFARMRQERVQSSLENDEGDEDNGDDLQALIDVGEREGIIEEEEGELIHSIIEFGDTRVGEVMTPRTEIEGVPVTATVREARDIIIDSKYSRLPVFRDQMDNVEGMIYVRDLLQMWSEGKENDPITHLIRPVNFVPETKSVSDLLEEMQKARAQLAIVVNEYGGVAGLVTVEDILEEIVGEIEDEDTAGDEAEEISEQADGCYEVMGSVEIGKIERLFGLEIEDDDFTTIAGLVISELGQVPRAGERLSFRGLEIEVAEADDRKIHRLRVKPTSESAQTD